MKKFLLLTVSLLLMSSAAKTQTDADCLLDPQGLTSQIDGSGHALKTLQPPTLDTKNRKLTHIVELPSGAKVEFSVGGCVHYGFNYFFSEIKGMPAGNGAELFAFIRNHIQALPLEEAAAQEIGRMVDALQKASDTPDNWQTPTELYAPFGDASAFLSIKNDGFVLTYDFPL